VEHVTTGPVTLRRWEPELAANVQRGHGFRSRCTCGWSSPWRTTYREARTDGREHAEEHEHTT
jgi:hypothetical protein